jgi:hypothetical protein
MCHAACFMQCWCHAASSIGRLHNCEVFVCNLVSSKTLHVTQKEAYCAQFDKSCRILTYAKGFRSILRLHKFCWLIKNVYVKCCLQHAACSVGDMQQAKGFRAAFCLKQFCQLKNVYLKCAMQHAACYMQCWCHAASSSGCLQNSQVSACN